MVIIMRILLLAILILLSQTIFAQVTVEIKITGIGGDTAENVRLYLSIVDQKNHPLLTEQQLKRLHKKAPEEIKKALQPYGYYAPKITSDLTETKPSNWLANYQIDPGSPIPIAELNIDISEEMRNDPPFQQFLNELPLKKGGTFNHLDYESIKSNLARLASERGYFDARFAKHRVEIDLETYEARVYLNYDGGPRFNYGEIILKQNVLKPELIRRYIPFESGSPYSLEELLELQQALNDTNFFRTVEVSPGNPVPGSTDIPIHVELSEKKPQRITFGLGYATNTGARTKLGWDISPLNRRGHRLDNQLNVSQIGYSLSSRYYVPVLNPLTDRLIYTVGIINEETDQTESTALTVGVSLERDHNKWRETISLNYQKEKFKVADDQGVSNLLIPGVHWTRTWAKERILVLDGVRFDLSFRGATREIFSDTDFFQTQTGIKVITPLGRKDRLISSGRIGATWTDEFENLPTSIRFFAGGGQSVRGYPYQSLGPRSTTGEVTGGKYLMLGSIEYEHSFNDKWGAALFYDVGNAYNELDTKLKRGAGIGARWQTPIGPVRIDIAQGLDKPGKPWRLHFSIGPDL